MSEFTNATRAREGKTKIGIGSGIVVLAAITLISLSLISAKSSQSAESSQDGKQKWGRHSPTVEGLVKITPLGSHSGEFCRNDRALLFEDPTGVRVLWDPGRTTDATDARLERIDVIVLSSVHGDHVGDSKPNPNSPGSCAAPGTISAAPNSVTAEIAAAKRSALLAGGEMADFLGRKIQNIRGTPTASCPAAGIDNELIVPLSAPCVGTLRPGGSRTVKISGQYSGVEIANFQAYHSNGIPASLVDSPGVAPGTAAYGGNDGGAVIQFSNGLTVYLTADTGLTGDMKTVVQAYYQPDLVVINIGDIFSLGPEEGAYAINTLIKPKTVIPSHINEAATAGGQIVGERLKWFSQLVDRKTDVVIPLSGITREFDGRGRCVNCGGK